MVEQSGAGKPSSGRLVTALSVGDVESLGALVSALDDPILPAQAAVAAWGLAGVGVRHLDRWIGVALIAPADSIPRSHPLSAGGMTPGTAGLTLVWIDPESSVSAVGKRLIQELARQLRGQVSAIEAQGLPVGSSPLSPPVPWLRQVGFHPVRYPTGRYRLDLDNLATWLAKVRRLRPNLTLAPLPANRTTLTIGDGS